MKTNPDDSINTIINPANAGFVQPCLSKREYFAALFMHAHIEANFLANAEAYITAEACAKGALVSADALIKALNGDHETPT